MAVSAYAGSLKLGVFQAGEKSRNAKLSRFLVDARNREHVRGIVDCLACKAVFEKDEMKSRSTLLRWPVPQP